MFYVYILKSIPLEVFYKGFTTNPQKRLEDHNSNSSKYTSNKGPWEMVYLECCLSKTEALVREKQIKRYNKRQLLALISDKRNLMR